MPQHSCARQRTGALKRHDPMAYMASIVAAEPAAPAAAEVAEPIGTAPTFSPLEWSIVRLARGDRLWTIRPRHALRRFAHWLIGRTGSPQLANERLEALRQMAVLNWHFGSSVPARDVAGFYAAGFTSAQYELLVSSIEADLAGVPTNIFKLEAVA